MWWPRLEEKLTAITKGSSENIVRRSKDEILEEILNNTREQLRREEIRLNAFQTRDEKIDTVIKTLEERMKTLSQSSLIMDSLNKFMKIANNKDILLKDGQEDPTNIEVFSNDISSELIEVANKMTNTEDMTEMMQKLKELSVDAKKETTLLLAHGKIEKQ